MVIDVIKKSGIYAPLNRAAKTQSENRSRERLLHKDTQNAENLKKSVTSNFKLRGRYMKKSTTRNPTFDNKKHQITKVITEYLNALREVVEDGAETMHIDRTYPHDYVKEAYEAKRADTCGVRLSLKIM
jgi:hypothetical protein